MDSSLLIHTGIRVADRYVVEYCDLVELPVRTADKPSRNCDDPRRVTMWLAPGAFGFGIGQEYNCWINDHHPACEPNHTDPYWPIDNFRRSHDDKRRR